MQTCFRLTPAELAELQALGYTLRGGPFPTQIGCTTVCGSLSSASSSSSLRSGISSVSPSAKISVASSVQPAGSSSGPINPCPPAIYTARDDSILYTACSECALIETYGRGEGGGNAAGPPNGGHGGAYSSAIVHLTVGHLYVLSINADFTQVISVDDSSVLSAAQAGDSGGNASAGVGTIKFSGGSGSLTGVTDGGGGGAGASAFGDGANAIGSAGGVGIGGGGSGGNGSDVTTGTGQDGYLPGGGGGGGNNGGAGAMGLIRITPVPCQPSSLSSGAGPITELCCSCEASPFAWSITVSGLTNAVCQACQNLNGTWTLMYTGNCTWITDDKGMAPCNPLSDDPSWKLFCSGGVWTLQFVAIAGTDATQWKLAEADWNCLGANVMPLAHDSGACNNNPATITITPV